MIIYLVVMAFSGEAESPVAAFNSYLKASDFCDMYMGATFKNNYGGTTWIRTDGLEYLSIKPMEVL